MPVPIEFPGVVQPVGLHAVRSLGVFPDQSLLWCLPQINSIGAKGNLTFSNDNATNAITFTQCVVDRPIYRYSVTGHKVGLVILDRRAYWEFGVIGGRYNIPQPNGTLLNQRSVRQLATLLFEACGEGAADVSALPADIYPQVNWDAASARLELQRLCHRYGCDVSLNLNNTVSVVQLSVGSGAPYTIDIQSMSLSVDPKIIPEIMRVYYGPTRIQSKVVCKPVGLDTDGDIKLIDDLSYTPDGGWGSVADWEQFPQIDDLEARILAQRTVGRWFRVEEFEGGTLEEPGLGRNLESIDQILPLEFDLLDGKQARVYGQHWLTGNPPQNENSEEDDEIHIPWSLDEISGIVRFSQPVLYRSGTEWQPPNIKLECAYAVRDAQSLISYRQEYTAPLGGVFGTYAIRQPNIFRKIITTDPTDDNEQDLKDLATALMNDAARRFATDLSGQVLYRGIQPAGTDGTVRQVVWSISTEAGFSTALSVNTESLPNVARNAERELWRQARQALGAEDLVVLRESLQRRGIGRNL